MTPKKPPKDIWAEKLWRCDQCHGPEQYCTFKSMSNHITKLNCAKHGLQGDVQAIFRCGCETEFERKKVKYFIKIVCSD